MSWFDGKQAPQASDTKWGPAIDEIKQRLSLTLIKWNEVEVDSFCKPASHPSPKIFTRKSLNDSSLDLTTIINVMTSSKFQTMIHYFFTRSQDTKLGALFKCNRIKSKNYNWFQSNEFSMKLNKIWCKTNCLLNSLQWLIYMC